MTHPLKPRPAAPTSSAVALATSTVEESTSFPHVVGKRRDTAPGHSDARGSTAVPFQPSSMVSQAKGCGLATRGRVSDSRERPATLPMSRATRSQGPSVTVRPLTGVSGIGDQVEPGDSSASRAPVNSRLLVAEARHLLAASRELLRGAWLDVELAEAELGLPATPGPD